MAFVLVFLLFNDRLEIVTKLFHYLVHLHISSFYMELRREQWGNQIKSYVNINMLKYGDLASSFES